MGHLEQAATDLAAEVTELYEGTALLDSHLCQHPSITPSLGAFRPAPYPLRRTQPRRRLRNRDWKSGRPSTHLLTAAQELQQHLECASAGITERLEKLAQDDTARKLAALNWVNEQIKKNKERLSQLRNSIETLLRSELPRVRGILEALSAIPVVREAAGGTRIFETELARIDRTLESKLSLLDAEWNNWLSTLSAALPASREAAISWFSANDPNELALELISRERDFQELEVACAACKGELAAIEATFRTIVPFSTIAARAESNQAVLADLKSELGFQKNELAALRAWSGEAYQALSRFQELVAERFADLKGLLGSLRDQANAAIPQQAEIQRSLREIESSAAALRAEISAARVEIARPKASPASMAKAVASTIQPWLTERLTQLEARFTPIQQQSAAAEVTFRETKEIVQRVAERWPPVYLGQNRVLVQSVRQQPLICFASDLELTPALVRHGIWEPALTVLIHESLRPGMRVMDVGAHVGYYTILMAGLVGATGEVYSFEPVAGNFQLLIDNCALNHCSYVCRLFHSALGNTSGTAAMAVFPHDTASSTLSNLPADFLESLPSKPRFETVQVQTLDEVVGKAGFPMFDFIKMDAEGAEFLVLQGGKEFLRRSLLPHTVIALEFNPPAMSGLGFSPADLVSLLQQHSFDVHILEDVHRERPLQSDDLDARCNRQLIARRRRD